MQALHAKPRQSRIKIDTLGKIWQVFYSYGDDDMGFITPTTFENATKFAKELEQRKDIIWVSITALHSMKRIKKLPKFLG